MPHRAMISLKAAAGGVLAASVIATTVLTTAALAHHGWSWADADQIELQGRITDIYIGPPHPTLKVQTASDGLWTVELGNPTQTQRAGFVEGSAKAGDQITVLGNRSQDKQEKRLKAVRITVGAKTFDIYPERIRTN